jgi:flagella basal body P-ring formation protein FlgA
MVRAGARIRAVAGGTRVRITREGTAVGEGARGDTILVRFPKQAAVPAIVVDSLTVSLIPPSSR